MDKLKLFLIVLLIILIVVTVAYFVGVRKGKLSVKPKITSTLLEDQIQSVRELSTIKYHYTNVGAFEHQSEFYGFKIPLTYKKFIISYDGEITAGIILDNSKITVEGDSIIIDLPPAQILSHEIDEDSLKIFDEQASIFNPLKLDDYSTFRKDQMLEMEGKAIDKGVLVEAEKDAKKAVEEILNVNPEINEKYKIVFK